jgi:predicted DNA-binding protein YlxM (UPF0122 family)
MARKKQDNQINNHQEAKRLYVEEGITILDIATKLNLSVQAIYKYRSSDFEAGDDWDRQRKIWVMSPSEISSLYAYSLKRLLVTVDSDPRMLMKPAIADAITKNIKNLQRIDPRHQYMGAIIDLIKAADQYLGDYDEKLQDTMRKHWDKIKNRMVEALNKEHIF